MDPTHPSPLDPVGAWLDGADADEVGLRSSSAGTVRVYARLSTELDPTEVDDLVRLGLDAEPWMVVVPGSLTRDQVARVLQHPGVVGVSPIGASTPFDPGPVGPAVAGTPRPTAPEAPDAAATAELADEPGSPDVPDDDHPSPSEPSSDPMDTPGDTHQECGDA